jgi:hypothetical protein
MVSQRLIAKVKPFIAIDLVGKQTILRFIESDIVL